jgi:hypothetical protein
LKQQCLLDSFELCPDTHNLETCIYSDPPTLVKPRECVAGSCKDDIQLRQKSVVLRPLLIQISGVGGGRHQNSKHKEAELVHYLFGMRLYECGFCSGAYANHFGVRAYECCFNARCKRGRQGWILCILYIWSHKCMASMLWQNLPVSLPIFLIEI